MQNTEVHKPTYKDYSEKRGKESYDKQQFLTLPFDPGFKFTSTWTEFETPTDIFSKLW